MAKINIPFSDTVSPAATPSGTVDTNLLESASGQVLNAQANVMDVAFKQADEFRSKAYAAELRAFEAEQNASLLKLLPAGMKEIGNAIDTAVEKIARIDQAQFDENLQKEMDAYMLSEGYKFQEEYLYYKQTLKESLDPDAPKKASAFVSSRMEGLLSKAPSEKAKLRMTEYMMKAKINALEDGFQIRDRALAAARQKHRDDATDTAAKMLRENPERILEGLDLLKNIGTQMVYDDIPKKLVDPYVAKVENKLWDSSVDGFLSKGNPTAAMGVLSMEASKTGMDPMTRSAAVNKVAKSQAMAWITSKKEIKLGYALALESRGDLTEGMDSAPAAADMLFFKSAAATTLPSTMINNKDDAERVAKAYQNHFQNHSSVMGPDTAKYLMDQVAQKNNPWATYAASMVLDDVINNNTGAYGTLGRQLLKQDSGNYGQTMQAALVMVQRVRAGENPQQAVEAVQKILTPATPQEVEQRKNTIKSFIQPSNAQNDADFKQKALNAVGYDVPFYKFGDSSLSAEVDKNTSTVNDTYNVDKYMSEYKQAFESNYVISGNLEAAKKATDAQMKSTWGITEVNGRKELMWGAPTVFFTNRVKAEKGLKETAIKAALEKGGFDAYDEKTGSLIKYDTYIGTDNPPKTIKEQRRISIQPIYNVTMGTGRTDSNGNPLPDTSDSEREYMVTDADTGMPIFEKDSSIRLLTVTYGMNVAKAEAKLRKEVEKDGNLAYLDANATQSTMDKLIENGIISKDHPDFEIIKQNLDNMERNNGR